MNSTTRPSSFKDLKCFDMGLIKGIGWAESMFETLNDGFQKAFLNWITVVLDLSQNEDDVKEWKKSFFLHFEDRCCELVSDIQDLHDQVILNIEQSLKRTQALCKTLTIEFPVFGQEKLGLYQEQLLLKKHIAKLEQMAEARQVELKELNRKQSKLCKALGKEVKIIKDDPLPSSEVLSEFQKYIEQLEEDKFNREEEFYAIKEKLTTVIEDLGYTPRTTFEKQVIYEEKYFAVTDTNMQDLENFKHKLVKEYDSVKEEINQLRNQIEQLWTMLDVEFMEREEFREKYTGNSYVTLEALRNELERCKELKKANLKVFIDKLRKELVNVWDECLVPQSTRDKFSYFYSECYTEDLMELHDLELIKWKLHAKQNKDLLNLLREHKDLWQRLNDLEESANGPDRFNNRGGKLLKEEKERNLIKKKIPKIEAHLQDLADRYFAHHKKDFLADGLTIEEYISDLHFQKENVKKIKLSARKAQREATFLTPMKGAKCTSVNMTPRNVASTSKKNVISASKRKVATDVKVTKPALRRVFTDPRRRSKGLISKTYSKQSSINRSKQSSTNGTIRDKENCQNILNSTYVQFQNDMSARKEIRSTLNLIDDDGLASPPLARALSPIPGSCQRIPKTLGSAAKSPSVFKKPTRSTTKSPCAYGKLTVARSNKKLNF